MPRLVLSLHTPVSVFVSFCVCLCCSLLSVSRREENKDPVPTGVKEVHGKLQLLSGAPLNVPITQEPGPLTEDMMTRQLAEMAAVRRSRQCV